MQDRVLVTGFTVFAGYQFNPSEWIAASLDGHVVEGYRVHSLVLPVSLQRALPLLRKHLEALKPRVVLGLGLAPRARKVTVELAAVSLAHYPDYPDEDGHRAELHLLDSGLRAYTTRLPLEAVRTCHGKGYPVTVSVSTGTYLCNAAAYTIHRYAHHNNAIGGFLHLPPTTELAYRHGLTGTMPLWLELETVKCILRETIRSLRKARGKP